MKRLLIPTILTLLVASCSTTETSQVTPPESDTATAILEARSFSVAKKPDWTTGRYGALANANLLPIYLNDSQDFYCGCSYSYAPDSNPKIPVDLDTCDMGQLESNDRAARIEWEHVVPRSWVAEAEGCSNVESCLTPNFKSAISDPYVLLPVVGKLNGIRSNYFYGEVSGEPRQYGACDFEMEKVSDGTIIEPPDAIKGDVARITLYHAHRYQLQYDSSYIQLLTKWSESDPIDSQERQRIRSIKALTNWNESPLDF